MGIRVLVIVLVLFGMCSNGALAREVTTYHGCTDASGNAVAAVLDDTIGTAFQTRMEQGRHVIRYNPGILPRLNPDARLFLYSAECARLNLGMPAGSTPIAAEARRADCWGLTTLLRSGLIDVSGLVSIQSALRFSADEWRSLSGPERDFDLPACYQEQTGRPSLASPPAGQDNWNTCARLCGDTLRRCQQQTCRGPDCAPCMPAYESCVAACDVRFAR